MAKSPLKILQISDAHLCADTKAELLGVNTQASLQAVINMIAEDQEPNDLIILSGDLSQDGSEQAYMRMAEMLKPLKKPVYCVPGNHDEPQVMAHCYPYGTISNHKHIVLHNWQVILLNTQKPGAVEGYLDDTQLAYLKECLASLPDYHAIVVFHHPPFKVGCQWLDNLWLSNADKFWDIISKYPKVRAVFCGHIHQEFQTEIQGIPCYSSPSTCIQFKPGQDKFGLDKKPPGFRWIHLFEEGRVVTGVKRVKEYVGFFDENAKGY